MNSLNHQAMPHTVGGAQLPAASDASAQFSGQGGITVTRAEELLPPSILDGLIEGLNRQQGMFLGCGIEDRNRYRRKAVAFINPPLELIGHGRRLSINALNSRGEILLQMLVPLVTVPNFVLVECNRRRLCLEIPQTQSIFAEEARSLQPSVLSPVRLLIQAFAGIHDPYLGLYGAFGYDLAFQFDAIEQQHLRPSHYKNLHLYLPDELYILDAVQQQVTRYAYDFRCRDLTTADLERTRFLPGVMQPRRPPAAPIVSSNLSDAAYAALVDEARHHMKTGDVFELVLHRRFSAPNTRPPTALFHQLRSINPSPYEFLLQMGDEQLAGTSPEMFVRVHGRRAESSPVSGTIRRGSNAMEDADRILALLNSEKDETELNMCTDVDRNDKARVCEPGSVRLLGRRLIELYTGLIHTADHVEGLLREGLDGIDAFLSHMWAVTLTGAPKRKAMQLIEQMEPEARGWYGGAIGALLLNGDIDTGITIRTAHLQGGQVHYRVGASLVYDSIGAEEEQETRTKAQAFFRALQATRCEAEMIEPHAARVSRKPRVVLIDYEDSFVHTLADYFRQAGAEVMTYRHTLPMQQLLALAPDMVVHSPGPGRPNEFALPARILALADQGIPQFGVCLGLQGIVEAYGGQLGQLAHPRQGKRWRVVNTGSGLFAGMPELCSVGAYHALYALRQGFPEALQVTAENEDGVIMAIRHRSLAIEAVQFHPESILSMEGNAGMRMIRNVVAGVVDKLATANGHAQATPLAPAMP
jgi:anthranilate synthase